MGQQDDIDVPALLLEIGDGRDILCLNILLIKENEMLIADMRSTECCGFLVVGGILHQTARDVF